MNDSYGSMALEHRLEISSGTQTLQNLDEKIFMLPLDFLRVSKGLIKDSAYRDSHPRIVSLTSKPPFKYRWGSGSIV